MPTRAGYNPARQADADLSVLANWATTPHPASALSSMSDPNVFKAYLRTLGPGAVSNLIGQSGQLTYGTPVQAAGSIYGNALPSLIQAQQPQVRRAGGGSVPGHDFGVDTVPAMLRGGEGVLTPELVNEVMSSQSGDPLVRKIREMLSREPAQSSNGEHMFQVGGALLPGALIRALQPPGPVEAPMQIPAPQTAPWVAEYLAGLQAQQAPQFSEQVNVTAPAAATPSISATGYRAPTPGTFSVAGAPYVPPEQRNPAEEAQRTLADEQRRLSLLRSALVLGTQGSMENLAPLIAEASKGVERAGERAGTERYIQAQTEQVKGRQAEQGAKAQAEEEQRKAQAFAGLVAAGMQQGADPNSAVQAAIAAADAAGILPRDVAVARAQQVMTDIPGLINRAMPDEFEQKASALPIDDPAVYTAAMKAVGSIVNAYGFQEALTRYPGLFRYASRAEQAARVKAGK